jgi:hypothetical protein
MPFHHAVPCLRRDITLLPDGIIIATPHDGVIGPVSG